MKPLHRKLLAVVLAPLLFSIVLLWALTSGRIPPLAGGRTRVHFHDPAGWHAVEGIRGGVFQIAAAPDGSIWMATTFPGGLTRWRNGRIHTYAGRDFGTQANYVPGGFAFGPEGVVWAALGEGIVRFDGRVWSLIPTRRDTPVSIAAAQDRVWVLEVSGLLLSCTVDRCETTDLSTRIRGIRWGERLDFAKPYLGHTAEGRLWLAGDGAVWYSDDASTWNSLELAGGPWDYASVSGGRLWLSSGQGLAGVAKDSAAVRYSRRDLGIGADARISGVWADGDRLLISTAEGFVERTSQGWHPLPLPAGMDRRRAGVGALAAGGAVWLTGSEAPGALGLTGTLLLLAAGIALFIWWTRATVRMVRQSQQERYSAAEELAGEAARGSASGEPPASTVLYVAAQILCGLAAAVAAWLGLVRWWPNAPALLAKLLIVFPVVLASWALSLLWKTRRYPIGSSLAFLLLFTFASDLANRLPARGGWTFPAALALLVAPSIALTVLPTVLRGWRVQKALDRGDYDEAMRRVDALGGYGSAGLSVHSRAEVLLASGRPEEAEALLRNHMPVADGTVGVALNLCTLADALLDQGRYEEAVPLYERSIRGYEKRGAPFARLAEIHILRREAHKALEYSARAIETEQSRNYLFRRINRSELGVMRAQHAWACAVAGRRQQAESALENAVSTCDPAHKPASAAVNYFAAMTRLALADTRAARQHLERAMELDPGGRWGIRARAARLDTDGNPA